jgi:hypothetical protein
VIHCERGDEDVIESAVRSVQRGQRTTSTSDLEVHALKLFKKLVRLRADRTKWPEPMQKFMALHSEHFNQKLQVMVAQHFAFQLWVKAVAQGCGIRELAEEIAPLK